MRSEFQMSLEGFRVRAADVADLAGVVALERGIAEAPHWAEAEYSAIVNNYSAIANMVNVDSAVDGGVRRCLLVAEAEGRLVGFAVGKVIGLGADGVGELESVAVDGTARRMGVGRALCRAVFGWCKGQHAAVVELEVRAGSGGAIALYTGLGFVVTGRRGGYYQRPVEDAVLMRLDLAKYK
jgi:[ribosomal protein S18]-alanine N-acetyltransferase